jgi:hypothetical protein
MDRDTETIVMEAVQPIIDRVLALQQQVIDADHSLGETGKALLALVDRLDEIQANGVRKQISRRMQRGISTKGIVQYDGRVEVNGGTREEFEAEQSWMDQLQTRLQPTYEDFVEPLSKSV